MEGIQHRLDCPGKGRRVSHSMRPDVTSKDRVYSEFVILVDRCLDCGRSSRVRRRRTEVAAEEGA